MWGFLTCLNDILVPHLKSIFDLNYSQAMLIQFAFFSAYFLFSIPWSRFVNRIGYHWTMVVVPWLFCGIDNLGNGFYALQTKLYGHQ
jgi:FHS family L-fucose permease-like MFS transporter